MLEDVVTQGEQAQNDAEGSSKTEKVDTTAGGDDIALGGNQFDGERNKWVNKTPTERDGKGRFHAVRESLERSQKKTAYIQALQAGAVEPTEEMSEDEWLLARRGQLQNRTSGITPPEFPADQTGDEAEGTETQAVELTPAEIAHIEAHSNFLSGVIAKSALDSETRGARDAFRSAVDEFGVPPANMAILGHAIADCDNAHEVFNQMGKSPDIVATFSVLPPDVMRSAVLQLSRELSTQKSHTQKIAPPKPKPPDPVGARASSSGFDVNDESIDADTWARQRNEQLAKKRGR
jgi:hypothetical protein